MNGLDGARVILLRKDQTGDSVHIQYFLRRRQQGNLYILVQRFRRSEASRLGPDLDRVISSFQVAEQPPEPTTTSTTAAP